MPGGAFVGWLLDKVPSVFKWMKDKKRIKDVEKIDTAIASGDDKSTGDFLRKVVDKEAERRKANS